MEAGVGVLTAGGVSGGLAGTATPLLAGAALVVVAAAAGFAPFARTTGGADEAGLD